jgi:hypothetical protein
LIRPPGFGGCKHFINSIKKEKMAKKVVTGEVRLSYVNLFEAKAIIEGQPAKYSLTVLISKEDKATIKQIQNAVQEVIDSSQGILKGTKGLKTPLRDGDEEKDSIEYENHLFMNVSSQQAPIVVDENRQEVINAREVYSGCYGRVSMNFFAYNQAGNKGVGVALNAVQKTRDGEALGGIYTKASVDEDFGDDLL